MKVINEKISFKTIYLPQNEGHGNARRKSVSNSSNELVALMDADDISLPCRFENQLKLFSVHPELDICGGNITEFRGEETNIVCRREVFQNDSDIKKDLKKRCPMNQVSVMFKKSSYDIVGGYIDWYCEEDYYLWIRMVQMGMVFGNVPFDIVNVRTGLDMSSRRGGWKYFKSERKLQKYLLRNKLISFPRYLYNVLIRFGGEVILPNYLRNKFFKLTRSKYIEKQSADDAKGKSDSVQENKIYPPFTVAMCVYSKDNPEWFDRALESVIFDQIVKPSEIVLVIDGPVPDSINQVIKKYIDICIEGI